MGGWVSVTMLGQMGVGIHIANIDTTQEVR